MTLKNVATTILLISLIGLQGCDNSNDCETVYPKIETISNNYSELTRTPRSEKKKICQLLQKNQEILISINSLKAAEKCPSFKQSKGDIKMDRWRAQVKQFMQEEGC